MGPPSWANSKDHICGWRACQGCTDYEQVGSIVRGIEQCPVQQAHAHDSICIMSSGCNADLALHRKNASQTSTIAKLTVRSNSYPGPDDLATFNDTDSGSGYLGGNLLRANRRLCCVSVRRLSDRNRTPSSGMGISHLTFSDSEGLGLLKVASCRHIIFLSSSLTMTI